MTASALEPGIYLISTQSIEIQTATAEYTVRPFRGYLLTIPSQGAPKLEIADIHSYPDTTTEKIESVRITEDENQGSLTLEARFIARLPETNTRPIKKTGTFLLNLSFRGEEGWGSEIDVTNAKATILRAHRGRLSNAEQPGPAQPATHPADKAPEKVEPPPTTSKNAPR